MNASAQEAFMDGHMVILTCSLLIGFYMLQSKSNDTKQKNMTQKEDLDFYLHCWVCCSLAYGYALSRIGGASVRSNNLQPIDCHTLASLMLDMTLITECPEV